jgi:Xaa-Pro aminopeptidase
LSWSDNSSTTLSQDDDEQEEEEDQEEFDEDDGATIESRFLQIVQRMHLTHLETAALRLAIARDDQAVKDAIEAFRSSLNERALMDALRYAYVLRMFVSS